MRVFQEMKSRLSACVAFGFMLAAFLGCSDSGPETAGATSETTNGIAVVAFDGAHRPVPQARVTLYQRLGAASSERQSGEGTVQDVTQFLPSYVSALETATADDSGMVQFETRLDQCQNARCYVEGIAGEDSSLMVWTKLDATDSMADEIELLPSVSLTVRTGAEDSTAASSLGSVLLDSSPYYARQEGNEFVFPHVPSGKYTVVMWDHPVADVSLDAGTSLDTLMRIPELTREYVFEDFDDGDSLNNFAKDHPNSGWHYTPVGNAKFIVPDSTIGFTGAIEGDDNKYLSLKFDISDTGFVMISTHLGLDTGYYDMSRLTAIRMKVRSDCNFYVTLEHYKEVEPNVYSRVLWKGNANENWHEIVFRPGEEAIRDDSYQVHFSDIATEIGFFSVYTKSGTFLQIDDIVFEGVDKIQ